MRVNVKCVCYVSVYLEKAREEGKRMTKQERISHHIIISTHHHIITLSHHQRKQERISESPGPSSQDVSSYISADGWTVD